MRPWTPLGAFLEVSRLKLAKFLLRETLLDAQCAPQGGQWDPKIPKNPQSPLQSAFLRDILRSFPQCIKNWRFWVPQKPRKLSYRVRVAAILTFPTGPVKGTKITSKMSPFDHLLGPLGVKMPLWGHLEAGLKMNVFLEGCRCKKQSLGRPPGAPHHQGCMLYLSYHFPLPRTPSP